MHLNAPHVYTHRIFAHISRIILACFFLLAGNAYAASAIPPTENIHYLAEHLPEAAQDARYYALPWTLPDDSPDRSTDEWRPVVAIAGANLKSKLANARGGLLTLGVEHNWSKSTRYSLLAFYDDFRVYGGNSQNVLVSGPNPDVPLDIPEYATFSNPHGRFLHTGLGLVIRHDDNPEADGWALVGGALLERLTLDDYHVDYRLETGADAGTEGRVEYGGSNNYITPFIGTQYRYHAGSRFLLLPRIAAGAPLPAGEMTMRITGPGFSSSTDSPGGSNIAIGDPYVMTGVGLYDRHTHLEYEIGALITYPVYERLIHEGVDNSFMISVSWRGK
jgi:hypothetical protein